MTQYEPFENEDEAIANRPSSLTPERAFSLLPEMDTCPEWEKKHAAGELPEGFAGLFGMLRLTWPDEKMSLPEAQWIMRLKETGSMRWLADVVVRDGNQVFGMHLIEAAEMALDDK